MLTDLICRLYSHLTVYINNAFCFHIRRKKAIWPVACFGI